MSARTHAAALRASAARDGVPVEAPYDPCGWMVFVWENGGWAEDWDGTVHANEAAGRESLALCRKHGYTAILVKAVPA